MYMRGLTKKVVLFLLVLVGFMISFNTIFAANININEKIKNIREKDSIENHIEKDAVKSLMNNGIDDVKRGIADITPKNGQKEDVNIEKVDVSKGFNKIFKVYYTKDVDISKMFKANSDFSGLISDKYEWQVPIFEDNDIVSSFTISKLALLSEIKNPERLSSDMTENFKKNGGKWQISLIGNYCPVEGINMFINDDMLVNLLNTNNLTNITDVKMVDLPYYSAYVIYIKNGNEEFGIPYTKREDLVGVKNGTIYNMKELMNIFDTHFPDIFKQNDNITNIADIKGGGGDAVNSSKQTTNNNNLIYIASTSIAGLFIIVLGIMVYRKRRNAVN
jgi:hypothetical protein